MHAGIISKLHCARGRKERKTGGEGGEKGSKNEKKKKGKKDRYRAPWNFTNERSQLT